METLATREAAARCGVSVSTFHNWVAQGRIKPIRQLPGARGAYLFSGAEVDELAAELAAEAERRLHALRAAKAAS